MSFSDLPDWQAETCVIEYGAILCVRQGSARLVVNFGTYALTPGRIIVMFPNDVVCLQDATPDFRVQMLSYSASMLREASLQLEQTIYSSMRDDRCRRHSERLTQVVENTFALCNVYFEQKGCTCVNQIVLQLLKAFFLGYHDYLLQNPGERPEPAVSYRMQELFNRFMLLIETYYKQGHDVSFYAERLHITPKYLNNIVQQITQHTPKSIIDHYVILQIKLQLRGGKLSIKQLADEFHFSDSSFFSRYFKQHTGLTPKQFQRS